jgi:hypothetical protein
MIVTTDPGRVRTASPTIRQRNRAGLWSNGCGSALKKTSTDVKWTSDEVKKDASAPVFAPEFDGNSVLHSCYLWRHP